MKSVDEEAKQRKIISKLWGKGNKSSHKIRELEKSATKNDHETQENSTNLSSCSSSNDGKLPIDDNSNSINTKPLAVVKPIVMMKSGVVVSVATDRTRVTSEASSSTTTTTKQKSSTSNN